MQTDLSFRCIDDFKKAAGPRQCDFGDPPSTTGGEASKEFCVPNSQGGTEFLGSNEPGQSTNVQSLNYLRKGLQVVNTFLSVDQTFFF